MEGRKVKLGELLIKNNLISQAQLDTALAEQKKSGKKLGQLLIELKFISEDKLLALLSTELSIPFIDLRKEELNFRLSQQLSEAHARRYQALILREEKNGFLVCMIDPLNIIFVDEIHRILKKPIYLALVRANDLNHSLNSIYHHTSEITNLAEQLQEDLAENSYELAALGAEVGHADAPVIKLLQSLFEEAIQLGASDIHIEPDEHLLRTRFRIDGVLHENIIKEAEIAQALSQRLKLMASLNIAERRMPQDGRFLIKVHGDNIDVRLSTLPTQHGESMVMRLLDQSSNVLNLDQIGMSPAMLKGFRNLLHHPHGLILVTGPTGSGKTTTLYGALSELNSDKVKIITAEDPVEYRLPRITQVQVHLKLGLSFAQILRAGLRQDPNIMMVGEIRDQETAQIAMRAALTGHLVLSTLHTNDSASSAVRLMDMGIEGFIVASTLRCILAQRLVRKICDACKEVTTLNDAEKNWLLGFNYTEQIETPFYRGKGCQFCDKTGYHGRIGVYELLELNMPMMDALRSNHSGAFFQEAKQVLKNHLLTDDAIRLASEGTTTISEVMRITGLVG